MIFENEHERMAFEYVCELASLATDRGCNDLSNAERERFKGLEVDTEEDGKVYKRPVVYDFDVLYWLKCQVK